MSNTIKLKRSSTAGATPTAGSLEYGELALNYTDGNLFFKTAANVVTLLASTKIANYSGNVNAGNLSTGGSLGVTGNANVGNLGATIVVATTLTGTLSTASQPNITSVGNLTSLTVTGTSTLTGNVTVANILVDTNKSVDVGNNRIMNVGYPIANTDAVTKSYVDSITSSGFTVQDDTANTTVVSAGDTLQLYGTANEVTVEITDTDQVTFGLPDNVTIAGNLSAGNLGTTGSLSVTGNANVGNIGATNVVATNVAGTLTTATQTNITSVGTLGSLSVTGNASTGNVSGTTGTFTNIAGTLTTASQTNITSVGTLGSLSVTGNITGGNLLTSGNIVDTDALRIVTGSSGNVSLAPNGTNMLVVTTTGANIAGTLNATGNANVGNIGATNVVATNVAGTLTTAAQTNITSVGTLGALTVTGNASTGNVSGTTGTFTNVAGTLTTASQTNITAVGTLGTLNVSGNANVGNIGATRGVFTGNIDMGSQYINNVTNPVQNQDVATKSYVDQYITSGITYHQPVAVATTTTLATATGGTVSYNNGTAGINATLTTTGTFLLIDSANVQTVGTRILVKNEANAAWNGIYTYANTTAIVRSTDADEYGSDSTTQLSINDYFFTTGGVVNEGTAFVVSAPAGTITFGTSNITFTVFSTAQVYDAGTGLTLTGTSFSVNASQTQITSVGTLGTLSVTGNANVGNIGATNVVATNIAGTLTTAAQTNITSVGTLGSLSVTGNVGTGNVSGTTGTFTNIAGTLTTAAQTNITSVGTLGSLSVTGNITSGNVSGTTGTFTNVAGTLTTAAQTNITSVGSLTALTVTGNASAGNLSTTGKVTATGNVSGSYFIGDGSLLTNLPSQQGNAITNGTSNVAITTSSGNVTVGINGTANTVVISPGSLFVNGVFATPKTITSNVQIAADSSAMVISPLTIGNGYSMSIPNSSTVYVWIPS